MERRLVAALFIVGAAGRCDPASASQSASETKERGLLASLVARCKKMIELQTAVLRDTRKLHEARLDAGEKNRPEHQKIAAKLAKRQKAIVLEAGLAMASLKDAAVAFPEVFDQFRADMELVHARLERIDVGDSTQTLQCDIIATLEEMIGSRR